MPQRSPDPDVAWAAEFVSTAVLVVDDGGLRWANAAARALVEPYGGSWESAEPLGMLLSLGAGETGCAVRWASPSGVVRWWDVRRRAVPRAGAGPAHAYEIADTTTPQRLWPRLPPEVGEWEWDLVDDRVRYSSVLRRFLGLPESAPLDYPTMFGLVHPEDADLLLQRLDAARERLEPWRMTYRMQPVDSPQVRVFDAYGEVVADAEGRAIRMFGVVRDVTAEQALVRELAFVTSHDPQTGVASRLRMMARLAELAAVDSRAAVLVVGVDHFKDVNDVRGFAVGDELLQALAVRIRAVIGSDGFLGRLGGDEFGVILPRSSSGDALAVGRELCADVVRTPVETSGAPVRFTVSVGVASVVSGDVEASLGNADLALYQAKHAGRNRAVLFTPDMYRVAERRVALLQRVADALDDDTMTLDAQPIVDLDTGAVTRHELLIRLRDGLEPQLGPADFLPHVEASDLVHRVDRWVIGKAVAALATPRARVNGLRLEANLSGRALENPDLGAWILGELGRADVLPTRLGVEITETAAVAEMKAAATLADQLIDAGCGFALDDFGAGFGSFSYLKHLRFTSLKIAGEFVHQADDDRVDRALVAAMVGVARQLGMVTVAEQVDRAELVPLMRGLGVDHGQGYHLGKPVPLNVLLAPRDHPA